MSIGRTPPIPPDFTAETTHAVAPYTLEDIQ